MVTSHGEELASQKYEALLKLVGGFPQQNKNVVRKSEI